MRSRMQKRRLSKRGAHGSLSNTARHTQPKEQPLPTPPVSQVATTTTACNGGYPVDAHDGQYPEAHSCRKESGASQRDARHAPHRRRRTRQPAGRIGANESGSCARKIEEQIQGQEGQNAQEQEVQVEVQVKGRREGQKAEEGEEGEEGDEEDCEGETQNLT